MRFQCLRLPVLLVESLAQIPPCDGALAIHRDGASELSFRTSEVGAFEPTVAETHQAVEVTWVQAQRTFVHSGGFVGPILRMQGRRKIEVRLHRVGFGRRRFGKPCFGAGEVSHPKADVPEQHEVFGVRRVWEAARHAVRCASCHRPLAERVAARANSNSASPGRAVSAASMQDNAWSNRPASQ